LRVDFREEIAALVALVSVSIAVLVVMDRARRDR
jgi:hypothetical protein